MVLSPRRNKSYVEVIFFRYVFLHCWSKHRNFAVVVSSVWQKYIVNTRKRIQKGQSRMYKLGKLPRLGTQYTGRKQTKQIP